MVVQLLIGLVKPRTRFHFSALIAHMAQKMSFAIRAAQTPHVATDPHVNGGGFLNRPVCDWQPSQHYKATTVQELLQLPLNKWF